ncbi:MAG: hypothetical protein Tp138OMZ00d2C19078241_14 [Prokaryotic dsDNA virus sp.]|jgi:hypothetical protein|nr:MAG: hypothetical protein Tp138OMZ00d2C19078241_14 [Prokaryotic dsDNA virus sp.]|tara:strand:+ start:29712 stop:29927 length:216 start_codon:yes stop_codon:yes gene_type:complete
MTAKHEAQREKLAADVAAFLESGKEIKQVPLDATGDRFLIAAMAGLKAPERRQITIKPSHLDFRNRSKRDA